MSNSVRVDGRYPAYAEVGELLEHMRCAAAAADDPYPCLAQAAERLLPEAADEPVVALVDGCGGARHRPVIEPGTGHPDGAEGTGFCAVPVHGPGDGTIAQDGEGVEAVTRLGGQEGHQRCRGGAVIPAQAGPGAAVVVDDDARQALTLHAVEHLHVEVRVPAEAVPGAGQLHGRGHGTPLAAEQHVAGAAQDAAEQVAGPLGAPGDVGKHGVIEIAGDAEVSGDH